MSQITPIQPASLTPGTWLIRDAGTDHETRVQFVSREPARGRKPALSRLFSAEWIMPGFDGHAIAYDEDLIEFYQLESEVLSREIQSMPADYIDPFSCGSVFSPDTEEENVAEESDPVLQVATASFAKEIGCSEQVASLALSDRGHEAISLHINEADLTEEQLSVLLCLVVDATYRVKSPSHIYLPKPDGLKNDPEYQALRQRQRSADANAPRTSHSAVESTHYFHRPVQLIDPLWGPGAALLEMEPEHPEVLRWMEENPDDWRVRLHRRTLRLLKRKQDRRATPPASSDTSGLSESSQTQCGDE